MNLNGKEYDHADIDKRLVVILIFPFQFLLEDSLLTALVRVQKFDSPDNNDVPTIQAARFDPFF